jgi:long-chain acyl-CoA synthetase
MSQYPTITQMLQENIDRYGKKDAFIFFSEEKQIITFNDLWRLSKVLARKLQKQGLQKGHQVILSGKPSVGWAAYALACFRLGIVVLPLDIDLNVIETGNIFKSSQASLAVVDEKQQEKWQQIGLKTIPMEDWSQLNLKQEETYEEEADINPLEDLAIVPFTSGTTGQGRGVMLTHSNLTFDVMGILDAIDINEKDRIFTIAPWYHITGFTCTFLLPLRCGATTLTTPSLLKLREILPREELTIILSPPKLYHKIFYGQVLGSLKNKLAYRFLPSVVGKKLLEKLLTKSPNFRFFVSGGGKLHREVGEGFKRMGLEMIDGYGLTETSPVISLTRPGCYQGDCIGKPIESVEIKIANRDPKYNIGEICTRGPHIMKGYYEDPQLTSQSIDEEGWFNTGDLGFIKDNRLFIKGRKKNVIVTEAGKNVYPEEVEPVLSRSPYIKQIVVYGGQGEVGKGEVIKAEIYPDWEQLKDKNKKQSLDIIWESIRNYQISLDPFKRITKKSFITLRKKPFEETTKKDPRRGKLI